MKKSYHGDGVNGKIVVIPSEQVISEKVLKNFVYLSLTLEILI